MELGNFLGKLKGSDKELPKQFLALLLTDEVVQAAVWQVQGGSTEIVALGTPVEWDGDTGTTSELVTAVDATISSATEGLESEPNEVILGIPHSWTDKSGVLGVKKDFILKIRKELELETIGYVIITDSVLSYLKLQEGTPTTSILIQVSRDELTLLLVRLGHTEAVEVIGRSEDVVDDVSEGIARFKVLDNLPSRIILFNSMHNLDDIIQNLLSVDWPKDFTFLHLPKIEALAKDVAIRALVLAGGSEVAKSLGLAVTSVQPPKDTEELTEQEPAKPELLTAQEIGFGIPETDPSEVPSAPFEEPVSPEIPTQSIPPKLTIPHLALPHFALPKLKLPKLHLNLKNIASHWWYLGGGILVLASLIFWAVWLLPSAVVTIMVTPKSLEQNVELTLSQSATAVDYSSRTVPATTSSISATGEKSQDTTGKKTVGTAATGEITLYNRTSSPKNFAKGTILTSNKLKFTLDADVTVASKSAGSDYVDVPGKSDVKLTASSIGTDSNIVSGTEFTIASFAKDTYIGKNDAALSGGTSEEVQVVSKEDQKSLMDAVVSELISSLKTQSSAAAVPGTGTYLIEDSVKTDSATYSAKIGEPAKSLSLSLAISATLLKYNTDDVTNLVNSDVDASVPAGYIRAGIPSTVELSAKSGKGDTNVAGTAKVQVALLPVIDKSMLLTSIKGKKSSLLENIFSTVVPGYLSADITVSPKWIPTRLKALPMNPSKITLRIAPSL